MGSAGPELPSMQRTWKLLVSEPIGVNMGSRVSRPVTFRDVSTELRKILSADGTAGRCGLHMLLESGSDGGERGSGLERPTVGVFCLVCEVFIREMETSASGTGSLGYA